MRPLAILIAVLALLLALWPGSHAYAVGMGAEKFVSSQQRSEGCASSHHGPERHDGDDRGQAQCCVGAICVFAGLPAATEPATPMSALALDLPVADTFLAGRDVAPPVDPPRPFA